MAIEKAFRISKTDLRIRPIYHRIRNRIEARICIAFTAYCILKELERVFTQREVSYIAEKGSGTDSKYVSNHLYFARIKTNKIQTSQHGQRT
ncbi:MAG TPA: hypothetical protein PLR72_06550, partial [Paludibacteraceae bacterium]|nr:hypothetical protein [Paludibacteraceae bacterium]